MVGLRTGFAAIVALLVAIAVFPAAAQPPASNPRIALVVGEQTYRDEALATTANDAGLIAETLQAAGFDVVGARDLDAQGLRTALRDFLDKAAAAGPDLQAFVYLAGRGLQYDGDNYFAPIDAEIRRDADVPLEAVKVSDFIHALATLPGRARIVVLDAARANPYAAQGAPLAPGLALVEPEPGVLIAFNAAPGTLAGAEQGPYGVYGKTLAGAMRQGGVEIAEVFDQTRVLVNQETEGALLPWSASRLDEPYFIFERAPDSPPPPILSAAQTARRPIRDFPVDQAYAIALQRDTIEGYREYLAAFPHSAQARRIRAILAVRREAAFWRRTLDEDTPRAYWTYLRVYPRGPHVADARRRLAILSAALAPPADFAPLLYEDLPPPPPDELVYDEEPVYAFADFGPPPPPPPDYYVYEDEDEWRDLPAPSAPSAIGVLPALEIAIPLVAGAVAYHGHHHRRDGLAPRDAPRFAPPPPAPPPLPANVKPVAPPAPRPVAADAAANALVKPLPPIGPAPRGGRPVGAKAALPGSQPARAIPSGPSPPAAGAPPSAPAGELRPPAPSNASSPPGKAPVGSANPPNAAPGKPAAALPTAAPSVNPPGRMKPAAPAAGRPTAQPPEPSPKPVAAPAGPKPPDLRKPGPVGSPQTVAPAVHAPAPAVRPSAPSFAPATHLPTQSPPAMHAPPTAAPSRAAPAPTVRPSTPSFAPATHLPAQSPPAMHAAPTVAAPAPMVRPSAPSFAPAAHPPALTPPAAIGPAAIRPPAPSVPPGAHAPAQPNLQPQPKHAPQQPPNPAQPQR